MVDAIFRGISGHLGIVIQAASERHRHIEHPRFRVSDHLPMTAQITAFLDLESGGEVAEHGFM
jgi:hypothetical protein